MPTLWVALVRASATEPAESSFASRRQQSLDAVLAAFRANPKAFTSARCFFAAEALFDLGHIDEGCQLASRGLDGIEPSDKNRWIYGGNSGFTAWPGIDCCIRYNRYFNDTLRQRFHRIYAGAVFYRRLSTSNHTLMASVTRYLATQVWGETAFKADPYFVAKQGGDDKLGTFFSADDPTGVTFIRHRIMDAVQNGPGEYASRPYGAEDILPFLTLADCATDAEISRTARLAYEVCIAQLAGAYLHGHLATFSTRSYPDMMTQQPWGVAALLWIYFGGQAPADPALEWSLRAGTTDYRLPNVLLPAGTDRSKAYVFRSLMNGWALYHYVNRTYALFSYSPKATHPKLLEQNYGSGVMWDQSDPTRGSHLWIANPAADAMKGGQAGNEASKIHTHGVTRFEQQVQYENASLSVFNIPADFRNPYVLGFIPGGYIALINDSKASKRIFLDYGSVLIAISSSDAFEWNPGSGIRDPAGKPHSGDSEFRVMATRAALAIETASPDEFAGASPQAQLEGFRQAVLARSQIHFAASSSTSKGTYVDRSGNALSCVFDGDDSINGKVVDYKTWPTLESPWMKQARGGDLTVTDGQRTGTYNLSSFIVNERQ